MVATPNWKSISIMPNNYQFTLTDPVSHERGLYQGTLKGTRAERANTFESLLRNKALAISFFLKSAPTQTRVAICTRNQCWIKYDEAEEERETARHVKREADASKGIPMKQALNRGTIYSNGIIPVYDMIKCDWISFDVDMVESIRGVASTEIDMQWIAREQYGKLGLLKIPRTPITPSMTIGAPVTKPLGTPMITTHGPGGTSLAITYVDDKDRVVKRELSGGWITVPPNGANNILP